MSEAGVGASTQVSTAAGVPVYVATVDAVYNAASGHPCKRAILVGRGREITRVACRERGSWRLTPPLIEDDVVGVFNQPAA